MTGVEFWGLVNGWGEVWKMHELFCTGVMEVPMTSANGACAKDFGGQAGRRKH
jgi:hypothetical protein